MKNRTIIIVLDSFGVGEAPDAADYGDVGANTFKHIYEKNRPYLPNMARLGIYNIDGIDFGDKVDYPVGAYGKAMEKSAGKNSPVGHWEISGYVNEKAFKTYPDGFPKEMIEEFKEKTGLKGTLYNGVGSGTDLIKKYGEEHVKTGFPIVYTSADSVFQIAAHEDVIPVERLYEICNVARDMLNKPEYNIGTVIARPFIGTNADNYTRTYNRKDIESESFGRTMLDVFSENKKPVIAIGKINDLFSGRGISKAIHTEGNTDGINKTIEEIAKDGEGLIFSNLVDFDMLYGHRNNVEGYSKALEEFDSRLPEIMNAMGEDDILIITADHGNDPSTPSTDHDREYIPILVYGKKIKNNINLGVRQTYADISATILDINGLEKLKYGKSFKDDIL